MTCKIFQNENEEKEIKNLIESNFCQRVLGNTNPVKLGRSYKELINTASQKFCVALKIIAQKSN